MKFVALVSGGKDSCYNAMEVRRLCLCAAGHSYAPQYELFVCMVAAAFYRCSLPLLLCAVRRPQLLAVLGALPTSDAFASPSTLHGLLSITGQH